MGAMFASFLKVVAIFIIGVPGVIAAYIFQGQDIVPDQSYMALIIKIVPAGLTGLILAALIASIMSSVDSLLAACSSLFTVDFYLRKHKNADEKTFVLIGRITMIAVMVGGILWVPIISSFSHMYVYFQQFISYIAPPTFAVYLAGLFYKRANHVGAMATLVLGTIMGFFLFFVTAVKNLADKTFANVESIKSLFLGIYNFFPEWLTGLKFLYGSFYHFIFCVAVMLIFSHLTPPPSVEKQEAAKRNDKGGFDDEPPYASRNVKIMTAAFLVVLVAVLIVFS
jgi:SSS family solute:Na+ symporter